MAGTATVPARAVPLVRRWERRTEWPLAGLAVVFLANYSVVVLFGTLALSLLWYYCPRYGGVHWFTGPVPTIAAAAASADGSESASVSDGSVEEKQREKGGVEVGVEDV